MTSGGLKSNSVALRKALDMIQIISKLLQGHIILHKYRKRFYIRLLTTTSENPSEKNEH